MNTYFVCYMHYVLNSHNRLERTKCDQENHKEEKYIYSICWKKSTYKWTCAVQTLVIQGSIVLSPPNQKGYFEIFILSSPKIKSRYNIINRYLVDYLSWFYSMVFKNIFYWLCYYTCPIFAPLFPSTLYTPSHLYGLYV